MQAKKGNVPPLLEFRRKLCEALKSQWDALDESDKQTLFITDPEQAEEMDPTWVRDFTKLRRLIAAQETWF